MNYTNDVQRIELEDGTVLRVKDANLATTCMCVSAPGVVRFKVDCEDPASANGVINVTVTNKLPSAPVATTIRIPIINANPVGIFDTNCSGSYKVYYKAQDDQFNSCDYAITGFESMINNPVEICIQSEEVVVVETRWDFETTTDKQELVQRSAMSLVSGLDYGDSLPTASAAGRIFFLKVTE